MTTILRNTAEEILGSLNDRLIIGNEDLLRLLLVAYFSRGHVLIEGPPGTGKTLTAKVLAHILSRSFKRIQFTSDMLPADITGANVYSPATRSFEFIRGPLFADVVLADEINRTPPRTQSALLEAMEERQVTVDGVRLALSDQFFLVATQNPHDYEGTFPLPEVQLDRFLFKLTTGHGRAEDEAQILQLSMEGMLPPNFETLRQHEPNLEAITAEIRATAIDESVLRYVTEILQETRRHRSLSSGSSVRGGLALCRAARVAALLEGRTYVIPDDIKRLVPVTLVHRVFLTPDAEVSRVSRERILEEVVEKVPFPS